MFNRSWDDVTTHKIIFGKWIKMVSLSSVMKCEKWTNEHESLWIEPMTSRTPGERSLHWATRTHGDPSSMQDACHTWTQLNGLVRLLSGTQIFSLPHAGVMLVSSLFTRLFLFFFFRRAPEISLKPEENRREELYYSDQYHSDPDAEEPLLSHKTNSPSYSAIWDYNFFSLLNSFQFCSHGLLSERIITRASFCWVPQLNKYLFHGITGCSLYHFQTKQSCFWFLCFNIQWFLNFIID